MEVEVIYSNKIGINQTLVSRSMHSFIATFTFKKADKHSFIKIQFWQKKTLNLNLVLGLLSKYN